MATSRSVLYLGLLSVLAGGTAWALIPGGHLDHADCLAEWRVTSRALGPSPGARGLDCRDGGPSGVAAGVQNGTGSLAVSNRPVRAGPHDPASVPPAAR